LKIKEIMTKFCSMVDWSRKQNFVALDEALYKPLCKFYPKPSGIRPTMPGATYMPKRVALNLNIKLDSEGYPSNIITFS